MTTRSSQLPGLASPGKTRIIILKRPAADSGSNSVPKAETNVMVPGADLATQATATSTAESGSGANELTAPQADPPVANPSSVGQNQQAPSQNLHTEEQSVMNATQGDGSEITNPSVNANDGQQETGNVDVAAIDAPDQAPPSSEPLPDAAQTEKLAAVEAAVANFDREALGKYLQDTNAAVQAAAFDALAGHDSPVAVENLLAEINDAGEPARLQALQLLSQSPQVDEQTVMATLTEALNSADPSISESAAQALAARGTPDAMNALEERFNSSDVSTRLTILQSVAQTEAGLPLLRTALSDSDESVRSAAAVLLQVAETTKNP